MAKSKNTTKVKEEPLVEVKQETKESTLYYFYSQGCGFCKKSEPIVDELNKEGKYSKILKLDVMDKDNQGLKQELESKYNKRCGTPWFIDAETGNQVCGFREKDVVEKWLAGEDIPAPPRPKGPMPRPPFHGAPKKEEGKWKEEYQKWVDENSHLPNLQTAEQILERPRPKTDPPPPPSPQMSEDQLRGWEEQYNKWKDENDHLPNLQAADVIINRIKQQGQPPVGSINKEEIKSLEKRMDAFDKKMDILINSKDKTPPSVTARNLSNIKSISLEQKVDKLMEHLGVK